MSKEMRAPNHGKKALITAASALLLAALALAGCDIEPVPGRYSYSVKYQVSSPTLATATVTYTDETGADQGPAAEALPWTVEFTMDYDYTNRFTPKLAVSTTLAPNDPDESITFSIIWKDYKVDFQEQILETRTVTNTDPVNPLTVDETLYGPPLPE
jgi:hypothetical protein